MWYCQLRSFRFQIAGGLHNDLVELQNVYLGHKVRVGVHSAERLGLALSTDLEQLIGEFHHRNQDSIRGLTTFY
jgi:hypothetical protein